MSRMHTALIVPAPLVLFFALLVFTAPARADDDALYGPDAPPGSAFIRLFNASDEHDLQGQVGDVEFDDSGAWGITEFEFLPPGQQQIVVGSVSQAISLEPDRFYTAVYDGQSVRLLQNQRYDNRLKALLILYNLTDAKQLSLRTPDGSATIIDSVAQEAYGTREVNAARARLSLFAGDRRLADTPPVTLNRGKAFSLFAVGPSTAPRLVWASN
ncbi:MAG: alginate O-acetyltransferase AlgF [Pseudomonadota bacterium]